MNRDHWPAPLEWLLATRRHARFRFVVRRVRTWPGMRVLDLGCGPTGRSTTDFAPASWHIVGLDRYPPGSVAHRYPGFDYVQGDARDLSRFRDGEFDLVISIGLLEHVTDPAAFEACAREIRRVAPQHALVVPYRHAWIEPHYLVPLFPVLPRRLQNGLIDAFNLRGHRARIRRDPAYLDHHIRWRSDAEYRAAFPGSRTVLTPTLETVAILRSLAPRAPGSVAGRPTPDDGRL